MKPKPGFVPFTLPILFMLGMMSCTDQDTISEFKSINEGLAPKAVVYALQPLGDFDIRKHPDLHNQVNKSFGTVCVLPAIALPDEAYYASTKRYRADKLIDYLKTAAGTDTVLIGLTDKDISTTKGGHKDWGVMGLGFQPGRSCVVSTFRLNKKRVSEQLSKVVLHEIGHTRGLPHCPENTCLMRDAKGGNPFDEESGFCGNCIGALSAKGIKPV